MRQIGRNIFSLGISRIISGVILFFVLSRLAAYLRPDGFGKFSLVLAYYTIFFVFVDLGISRYVIKKVSEDKSLAPVYLGNFLFAQLILAIAIFFGFVSIPRLFHYDAELVLAMRYAGIGLLLSAVAVPFAAIVQAWQKIHLVAIIYFIDSIVRAVWAILAIVWGKGIAFIYLAYIVTGLIDVFTYWMTTKKFARPKFVFDRVLTQKLFFYSVPFAFISGFEMIIAKADVVLQKFFLPFSEIGLYSAPYRILDFLTFVPATVAISLFPILSEVWDLHTEEVRKIINRISRYMIILALPLGVASTLFAEKIIFTLFGRDYAGSVLPFQILIWSTVITFLYAIPNVIMQVKMTRKAMTILGAAAFLNILANWILVPSYGIIASAWLTVATYALVAILYSFSAGRIAEFHLEKLLVLPILGCIVMVLAVWPFRNASIFTIILIALASYFGTLVLTKFF